MGDKYSQDFYRAIGVHDPRWVFSAYSSTSTATQDGAEPDQPIPGTGQTSFAQLQTFGTVDAGTTFSVQTVKAGAPVGGTAGGRFVWRSDTDTDDNMGWLAYNKVTAHEFVRYDDNATGPGPGAFGYQKPKAIRTPDHKIILVYADRVNTEYRCSVRNPTTQVWTHNTIVGILGAGEQVDVARLPSGRLLAFHGGGTLTEGGTGYNTISMHYSDDDGVTWTLGAHQIDALTGGSGIGLSVAFHGGFITLLTSRGHYVSADLGASFSLVAEMAYGTNGADGLDNDLTTYSAGAKDTYSFGDMTALADGRVLLVKPQITTTPTATLARWVKASPYAAFNDDPEAGTSITSMLTDETVYGPSASEAEESSFPCAVCVDDEGFVYVVHRGAAAYRSKLGIIKLDPVTLARVVSDDNHLFTGIAAQKKNSPIDLGQDADSFLSRMTLVPHLGGLVLLTNHFTDNADNWNSISAFYLGGYSNYDWRDHTFGPRSLAGSWTDSGIFYVPYVVPNGLAAWTPGGSAGSSINTFGHLRTDNTDTAGQYWTASGSAGSAVVMQCRLHTYNDNNGNDCATMRASWSDGSNEYRAFARFAKDGASLYDPQAAANVGAVTGLADAANPDPAVDAARDWLLVVDESKAHLLYKAPTEHKWTSAVSGTLAAYSSTSSLVSKVTWGHINGSTNLLQTNWHWIGVCCEPHETGIPMATASTYTNPDDLLGRPFALTQLYVEQGTRVSSRGSSSYQADTWTIPPRYEYGVHNIDPMISASPSVPWMSTTDAAEQKLIWELDGDGVTTTFLNSSIFVYIGRPNFGEAFLEGYNTVGPVWDLLATIDALALDGISYSRNGSRVSVDTGTSQTATRYFQMDELVGGYVVFDADGSGGGPWVRRIEANSEGLWTDADTRRLEIRVKNSDLASIPVSGDAQVIAPQVVTVRHKLTTSYPKYRIRIPATTTAEGKHSAGVISVGPLVVLGRDYDYPWTWAIEPNTEISEGADGQRRVEQMGPARRTVEVSWPEGWDQTKIQGDAPDPDYIVARDAAGYTGIGVRDDATILEGLVRRTAGGQYPVVLIPKVDPATGSSDEFSYTGVSQMLYGRTLGGVTRQVINGDDWTDEVAVLNAITVEEEV